MPQIHVAETAVIPAPPEQVYNVIADYRVGHPAILPKPYFERLTVIRGGMGAGTVAEVHMNVFGAKSVLRLETTEPEPGRVLVETDETTGVTTTFTVEPAGGGQHARVRIETESRIRSGLAGLLERIFNPIIMRRIYRADLALLAGYLEERQPGEDRLGAEAASEGGNS